MGEDSSESDKLCPPHWEDKGEFWLHLYPQGSREWLQAREGRLTASNFYYALRPGHKREEPTLYAKQLMRLGSYYEGPVRRWYAKQSQQEVEEWGLAVPKWQPRLGASIDGSVGEGMIEIKCPRRMYTALSLHEEELSRGEPGRYNHISPAHYLQMQGCLAITGKSWCDYIVYAWEEERIYQERVLPDVAYWESVYPLLVQAL
jgi:hypothetical protein